MPRLTPREKTIKLWMATRHAGDVLSGQCGLTPELRDRLHELSGISLIQTDIERFPRVLSTYKTYTGTIYRGVFESDCVLVSLLESGISTTTRYYSCTKNYFIAAAFGNKIILCITMCNNNYDISDYSSESEVILGKDTYLELIRIETRGDYKLLHVSGHRRCTD